MKRDQWQPWWKWYVNELLPDVGQWLLAKCGCQNEGIKKHDPQNKSCLAGRILEEWFHVLQHYKEDDCTLAGRSLVKDQAWMREFGKRWNYDKHPAEIAALAAYFARERYTEPPKAERAEPYDIEEGRQRLCERFGFKDWNEYKRAIRRRKLLDFYSGDDPIPPSIEIPPPREVAPVAAVAKRVVAMTKEQARQLDADAAAIAEDDDIPF